MTDGEREILFQMQQLQMKWANTVEMCLAHMLKQREAMEGLHQDTRRSMTQGSKRP